MAHTKAAAELETAAATQAILALTGGQIAAKLTPQSSRLAVRGLRRGRRLPRVRHCAAIAGGGRLVSRTVITPILCASAIRRRLIRIRIRIRRSLVHLLLRSIRRCLVYVACGSASTPLVRMLRRGCSCGWGGAWRWSWKGLSAANTGRVCGVCQPLRHAIQMHGCSAADRLSSCQCLFKDI